MCPGTCCNVSSSKTSRVAVGVLSHMSLSQMSIHGNQRHGISCERLRLDSGSINLVKDDSDEEPAKLMSGHTTMKRIRM